MNFKPNKQQLLSLLPDAMVLTHGPRQDNAIYLSFDDGPDPEHTPRLLDLLGEHRAQASFFLIGKQVERYPALAERIVAEGHALGNHSFSHPRSFGKTSLQQQLQEIERTDLLLAEFDQRAKHRFRPPRGSFSLSLLLHFVMHRRAIAYWSYDSLDYKHLPDTD
ncbi:MAG TPA: polysaccharide deacetylase family protein, partial [Rhodanobacter sp.]